MVLNASHLLPMKYTSHHPCSPVIERRPQTRSSRRLPEVGWKRRGNTKQGFGVLASSISGSGETLDAVGKVLFKIDDDPDDPGAVRRMVE